MDKRKKYGIRITSLAMSLITTISFAGCSIKKNDAKYDGSKIITTNSYSDVVEEQNEEDDILVSQEDSIKNSKEETTANVNNANVTVIVNNSTNNNIKSIDTLLNDLNKNTKQFSSDMQEYLKCLVVNAYNNYDELSNVLCQNGFPDKCTFLEEKIIEPLKNIETIDIISNDNPEFYELKSEYGTSRWIEEEKKIIVFCDSYNVDKYPQILMEEIIHSSQKKLNTTGMGYAEYCIFAEGEANSYCWPLTFGKINNSGVDIFYDDSSMNNTNYGYGTGYFSHALASKYFMYLLTLTDYNTVNEFKNNLDSSIVTNKLSELYGIDGKEFYNEMKEVVTDSSSGIYDKRTPQMVYCEKTYNKCINQKINSINNSESAKKMLDLYRYMNIQYGYEYSYYDENTNSYTDKTNERIGNIDTINNLYNKCKKYGVFNVSENDSLNKEAFYAFVCPERNSDENIYFISCNDANIKLDGNNILVSNNLGAYETNINNLSSRTIKSNYNYLDNFDNLNNINSKIR